MNIDQKYKYLQDIFRSSGKVVIAFSGGVDSTFLLKAAVETLGTDKVLACIGISGSLAQSQYAQAIEMAQVIGATVREIDIDELDDESYCRNKADRCFHCKSHLYGILIDVAKEQGFDKVLCGSNFDDKDDYRPGNRAASVFGVGAPLMESEMTKSDIRELSKRFELRTHDVPASPCLASRVSYGLEITEERLKQVEKAEDFLRSLGFVEFRVRHHGDVARIEVPTDQIDKIMSKDIRTKINTAFKPLGFKFVTVDLHGFRSGSLNESLTEEEKRKHT